MITSWPQYRGPVMPTAGLSSVLCHSTAAAFSQHQYLFSTWTKGQIITEGIQCLQSLQKDTVGQASERDTLTLEPT